MLSAICAVAAGCLSNTAQAQILKDESVWTYEAKQKAGNAYDVIIHLKLPKGWHIYSMKPGGDGMLMPPSFSFKKDPKVKLVGTVAEKGKLRSEVLIPGDPKINMYFDKVDYVQQVTVDGNTVVAGSFEYQICNDKTCLPPASKAFKIAVKGTGGAKKI